VNGDDFEDGLEALYKKLGAAAKRLDEPDTKEILKEIKEMEMQEKKSNSPHKAESPTQNSILPQWSVSGKKVDKMKIEKRRRPGSGGNIEPMGL
jgi:hypothetical protein